MNIDWWINPDFSDLTVDSQTVVVRILLWLMAALTLVIIMFAILILRQSSRMATVLPTSINSTVKLVAWGYLIFCIVVLGIIVNYIVL